MDEGRRFWMGLVALAAGLAALTCGLWQDMIPLTLLSLVFFMLVGMAFLPAQDETKPLAAAPAPSAAPFAEQKQDHIPVAALDEAAVLVDARDTVLACNSAAQRLGPIAVGDDVRSRLRHPDILAALDTARRSDSAQAYQAQDGTMWDNYILHFTPVGQKQILVRAQDIAQIRANERMRADFVANASHELRTPLAALLGFIETLSGPAAEDAPARARFLGIMEGEARRMSRLIDDLLSLSRIEQDKYVRPNTPIALPPVLEQVRKAMAPSLEAAGRALRIECPAELPHVVGVGDQIAQVLHNLISNAEKYGAPGTDVQVRVRLTPDAFSGPYVEIAVIDQGEGIASAHLPRLTERFYRVDSGRSRALGGTGLGLAIVKHIVERHRGALSITSQQGAGSCFAFTLPIANV